MIQITVTLSSDFIAKLNKLRFAEQFGLRGGSQAVYVYLVDYHKMMDWRGPNWMPGPNSGQFAENVVKGWNPPVVQGSEVAVTNTFGLLDWKIRGGTIVPKAAKALTIPLVPQAKGVAARLFGGLFRTGNTLSISIGQRLEAIYALKYGVTQFPWPDAMPSQAAMKAVFVRGAEETLERELK